MIQTQDPTTWITANGVIGGASVVQYENTDGLRWRITGTCNACGLCENPPEEVPSVVTEKNYRYVDGVEVVWERTLIWHKTPGEPGAVEESLFGNRLDIPMTPDVNDEPRCTLNGEWM
jgi:hypothetical protein